MIDILVWILLWLLPDLLVNTIYSYCAYIPLFHALNFSIQIKQLLDTCILEEVELVNWTSFHCVSPWSGLILDYNWIILIL